MKKVVNGRIINVSNIELFEKAMEDLAINRTANNATFKLENADIKEIDTIVTYYDSVYESMPYPLYAIDDGIKYAVLANCIRTKVGKDTKMWVDNGLVIMIDIEKRIAIKFVNKTWGLVNCESIEKNNLAIEKYKEHSGYKEFKWVLDNILNGRGTGQFYNVCMKEFIEACKNESMLIKWELSNILNFGRVPKRLELEDYKILDIAEGTQYTVDLFISGLRKTKENKHVWNLFDDGEIEIKSKYVKSYGFEVYKKQVIKEVNDDIEIGTDKLEKCNMIGLLGLFLTLSGIKSNKQSEEFEKYTGIICDDNIIYEINNRVFLANKDKHLENKEIARGVSIYSYDRGMVYLSKKVELKNKIDKENIYSYSIYDGQLRLCRIQYVRRGEK